MLKESNVEFESVLRDTSALGSDGRSNLTSHVTVGPLVCRVGDAAVVTEARSSNTSAWFW